MFVVRQIGGEERRVNAEDHRAAARLSGLARPGAQLVVHSGQATVRYHVDTAGRLREQSSYTA